MAASNSGEQTDTSTTFNSMFAGQRSHGRAGLQPVGCRQAPRGQVDGGSFRETVGLRQGAEDGHLLYTVLRPEQRGRLSGQAPGALPSPIALGKLAVPARLR